MLVTVVQVGHVRMKVRCRCVPVAMGVPALGPSLVIVVVVPVAVGVLVFVVHRGVKVAMLVGGVEGQRDPGQRDRQRDDLSELQ